MKTLIQRVQNARVDVDQQTVGSIENGILAYVGIRHTDTIKEAKEMVDKILTYRIFTDENDKLMYNVQQVNGGLLLVSQFTLMADTDKGRRPDFKPAMAFADAQALFEQMVEYAQTQYPHIATGEFGADMQVHSINDGPMNFILEK